MFAISLPYLSNILTTIHLSNVGHQTHSVLAETSTCIHGCQMTVKIGCHWLVCWHHVAISSEYLSNVVASICPMPAQYLSNISHLGLLARLSNVSCEKNGCHCLLDNMFQGRGQAAWITWAWQTWVLQTYRISLKVDDPIMWLKHNSLYEYILATCRLWKRLATLMTEVWR